ncbi:MAG TPA: AAA family ATPase [Bacilli bacterium]|nr:AAA family ATPase [Bacilli bacterium]
MFLQRVTVLQERIESRNTYPFSIPALRELEELEFRGNVTFFVGENGSGKSTLLEAIARQCGFHTAGGGRNNSYEVEGVEAPLADALRLSWMPKISNGFFLRAESFFQFATYLDQLVRELPGERESIYAPYGGRSLHERSHGEAFLALFTNRFGRKGIYLLDEPEAALSPARQLAFLRLIHQLEREGQAQFLIATHSPILLGYPGAQILNFDASPVEEIRYEETDHYVVTKRFMQDPQSYLRELFEE